MSRFVLRHRLGIARHALPATLLLTAMLAMILTAPNHAGGKKDPPPPPDEQISDSTDLDGNCCTPAGFKAIIAYPATTMSFACHENLKRESAAVSLWEAKTPMYACQGSSECFNLEKSFIADLQQKF